MLVAALLRAVPLAPFLMVAAVVVLALFGIALVIRLLDATVLAWWWNARRRRDARRDDAIISAMIRERKEQVARDEAEDRNHPTDYDLDPPPSGPWHPGVDEQFRQWSERRKKRFEERRLDAKKKDVPPSYPVLHP